jgi:hypothetical protein
VKLNTLALLSFYENTREAQGFTAFITPSNAAVKVVFYSVELLECVCVYYCRTYDKAVCGGGGGQ